MNYCKNMLARRGREFFRQSKYQGFTIIELLIALGISLVLIAGIVGLVSVMRRSYNTQDALTQIQENERFALSVLGNVVRDAGYYPSPQTTTPQAEFVAPANANPDNTTFIAGQFVIGTAVSGASDTLNIRVESNSGDGIQNCQGDTNTSGAKIVWTNSFSINASNQLVCTVSQNGAAPGTPTILADNVISMKIMYGLDTDGDGSADTYVNASSVTNWGQVMTVQFTMVFTDLVNNAANGLKPIVHTVYIMNNA